MSTEFQIFISSTVDDLKGIRKKLAKALEQPGRIVRCSEDPNFPVEPGMTSHDACLAVVRRCHAFVLLIGTRFGGEYQDQNKSITWREWEEACSSGLAPIILVEKKTNDLCRLIAKHRAALEKRKVSVSDRDLDKALEKKLKNELVGYHHAPALQRFVDAVRKGHKDNWKLDWNGRAQEAIEYVNQNLAVQAASAERRRQEAREELHAGRQTLADLSKVSDRVRLLLAGIRVKQIDRVQGVQAVLDVVESLRSGLFSFAEGERYTLVVHEARRRRLYPIARAAHPAIPNHGRVWSFGQGHVGEAVRSNQLMVSGDIRHTAAWVRNPGTETDDMRNYVSVMAKPYYRPNGTPGGTVTLTSGRVDHFTKLNASATLAFDTVVSFVNMVLLQE